MDRLFRRLAAAAAALLLAVPASALTVGTFDIEDFHIAGTSGVSRKSAPYDQRDMRDLARAVRKSRADVLALQEVEGDATMRYFAVTAMHGWKYAGNDTAGVQDLYFMWDPKKVTLQGRVQALKANLSRTPVAARFADSATGRTYTLVNAHLDNTAADEQMKELYRCAKTLPQPVILLGNFGDPDLTHPDIAFLEPEGKSRTIKVGDMKSRIVEPMSTTAYSGGWKAGVIVSADRMQTAAANAFLKSLEEPTPRTVYFLTTDRPDAILPTIVSRCQLVSLDRPKGVLEGKSAKTIAEFFEAAKCGGFLEKAKVGKGLAALLGELKDGVEDSEVPMVRKKFYMTIMAHAREWMLNGSVPRHFAFRNIEAVEEAYSRSERFLPDEAVLTYMMDKFVLPKG